MPSVITHKHVSVKLFKTLDKNTAVFLQYIIKCTSKVKSLKYKCVSLTYYFAAWTKILHMDTQELGSNALNKYTCVI